LQVRRKRTTFHHAAAPLTVDTSLMQEPFFFEGGVVDLAANTWDFLRYPKVHRVVSKASIRPDLADMAWLVLRQTLRMGREISTVKSLWWGFLHAGSVLDGFVDDLHQAELPAVQAARYSAVKRDSHPKLTITRRALCCWLEEVLGKPHEPADAQRLARILGWLREMPIPKRGDTGSALSTDAFARLLHLCAEAVSHSLILRSLPRLAFRLQRFPRSHVPKRAGAHAAMRARRRTRGIRGCIQADPAAHAEW